MVPLDTSYLMCIIIKPSDSYSLTTALKNVHIYICGGKIVIKKKFRYCFPA